LISDFVCAFRAAGKHIVDLQLVSQIFSAAFARWPEIFCGLFWIALPNFSAAFRRSHQSFCAIAGRGGASILPSRDQPLREFESGKRLSLTLAF
jgi:hypothetical protein